ncbi:MAG: tetratricopeptide repeat protein, partial [Thermodesulfobacteriota bacterium]
KLKKTTRRLRLTGQGEFFLHPQAYEILETVGSEAEVLVETNGNVDLDAARILESGLAEIHFSIDGLDQEMYARYRRGGRLEKATTNLENLARLRRAKGADQPKIVLRFLLLRHNEMYEEEAEKWALALGADEFLPEAPHFEPGFSRARYKELMPLTPKNQRLEWVDFENDEIGRTPDHDSRHCLLPLKTLVVDVNGDLAPCPGADPEACPGLGNLLRQELEEIWQDRPARDFRFRVFKDKSTEKACRLCSLPLADHSRFFEGTEFAESPLPRKETANRTYTRHERLTAQEVKTLCATGRRREAEYFLSLGKAEKPQAGPGDEILSLLERLNNGAVDLEATRRETAQVLGPLLPGANVSNAADAYNNLAFTHFKNGDYDQAVKLLREALKVDPYHRYALLNLNQVLKKAGRPDLARPYLEQYLEKHPEDKEVAGFLTTPAGPPRAEPPAGPPRPSSAMPAPAAADTPGPAAPGEPEVARLNRLGLEHAAAGRLEPARACLVQSLAHKPDQPDISRKLLETLWAMLSTKAREVAQDKETRPVYFDRTSERNPHRGYFLKYVPEELVPQKTGLNILFLSDLEIAGNQVRFMKMLNHHTTHKARNIILNRDYLNYGEDLVLDQPETVREAKELIQRADFFHFVRGVIPIPGVDWSRFLNVRNCLVDYFGGDIKFNKQNVVEFHRRTGIFGLNKYDFGMYRGAEFLMYHFPTIFDADEYPDRPADLSFYDQPTVVIGHAPTNPERKHTHELLPLIERVNRRVPQELKVDLIMGASNEEAMRRKQNCDIFIDLVRPESDHLSGCPGQNSHESLALGKVTICSLDNFFLSFYPDTPIFSASLENFEVLLHRILTDRALVEKKMSGARAWLRQFHPVEVLRKYLHVYQMVMTGNKFVHDGDPFFANPREGALAVPPAPGRLAAG